MITVTADATTDGLLGDASTAGGRVEEEEGDDQCYQVSMEQFP